MDEGGSRMWWGRRAKASEDPSAISEAGAQTMSASSERESFYYGKREFTVHILQQLVQYIEVLNE